MPVHVTLNHIPEILRRLERLGRTRVEVGVLGPGNGRLESAGKGKKKKGEKAPISNAQVAFYAEYGTSTIPARGLLSRPLALHRREYIERLGDIVKKTIEGHDPSPLLERLGLRGVRDIKTWVADGSATPPNRIATMADKGSTTALIDTGQMLGAIQHRVVEDAK